MASRNQLIIIGGGLAGAEAAWQAAIRGVKVKLFEMRPVVTTGAHRTGNLAELVCSNSFGSNLPDRASGLLKQELRILGSMLLGVAEKTSLPAGSALAVGREHFSELVTKLIREHENIEIIRQELIDIPDDTTIIASGPLTSNRLSQSIQHLTGSQHLYFFDAVAPIVDIHSVDMCIAYRASRYDHGSKQSGDYINCPLDPEQYSIFVKELIHAERIELKEFEQALMSGVRAGIHEYFEGCLPIEVLASRGDKSLEYGPLRPIGLRDPKTGKWPHAVVQLRQDDMAATLYNLVGFQTNLTISEQTRVFRLIPGLEHVNFERFGQMHRNTFIHSPKLLDPTLQFRTRPDLFFAGQITGVEGYVGNIATGLLAGWNAARLLNGQEPITLPETTMLGALTRYITQASPIDFQPMKANFGILPELGVQKKLNRLERSELYSIRAINDIGYFLSIDRLYDTHQ